MIFFFDIYFVKEIKYEKERFNENIENFNITDKYTNVNDLIRENESKLKKSYDWFSKKPLQILQPTGAIVIVMTRSSSKDLTGFLLDTNTKLKVNKWEVLKLPVITQNGAPLWPQFWKLDELKEIKDSVSKEEWNFKWMQNSKSD